MEFANKDENQPPKSDLLSLINFKKQTKMDVDLLEEFVQHLNRVHDRDPESFLMDHGSYIQIALIKKQVEDTMKEISQALEVLNEFKNIKSKLEQINKCILFDII